MSSSGSSPAKRALEDFVAGRLPADRLVAAVAGRFYGAAGKGEKDALRPIIEVAERAAPGVVSLERTDGGNGFDVRAVERVIPDEALAALRSAAAGALTASWSDAVTETVAAPEATAHRAPESWLARMVSAVRRLFSASA